MEKLQTLLESATGLGHIHVCYWVPEGEPKGIVQLVHGMAEHIARYDDFACFLAGQQVAAQIQPAYVRTRRHIGTGPCNHHG